jgi:alpha-glucosidase
MSRRPTEIWSVLEDGHRITFALADDHTVRLRIAAGAEHQRDVSYAVVPRNWSKPAYHLTQESGYVEIETDKLDVELRSAPFAMTVRDPAGRTLFETGPRGLRFDGERITLSRKAAKGELSLGMGEVGETFDRSGGVYTLWNTDDFSRNPRQNFYGQVSFAMHLNPRTGRTFGLFIDNPGRQVWDLGNSRPSTFTYETLTGDFELWLLFSDTPEGVLRDWSDLTGHMERPPLWGLGYHQSRWSYYPESRVRTIASEFRKRKIPCDALYLDIDYMEGYRVFTWNHEYFPNPAKMLSDLAADGFHVVTIVDPGVKIDPQYEVYREFLSHKDFFCMDPKTSEPFVGTVWPGKVHFPDFTLPAVRELWGELQKKALLDQGVAGIWNDMNEPHTFDSKEFPGHVIQYDFGRKSPHAKVHQVYGLTMAQASHDGFVKARPDKRPFIITRSGWAGVQRYALMWTGDNQSTWASMTLDFQLNLSMGLTGIPFVGCDIGGFANNCYPELYARWIEWGVFQPFCRTHSASGTVDQEPWSFGSDVEKIARQMIELRMQLLPYIYTAFVQASEAGMPVNRPLVFAWPADTNCQRLADQFLLGDSLLVAPVLLPAQDQRMVYLPVGGWYHWWSDKLYSGPSYTVVAAPPSQPPLFVRAGAVIPMQEALQYVGEKKLDVTRLEVFVDSKMSGSFVEDDGATTAYREGAERRTAFNGTFDGTTMTFAIDTGRDGYTPSRKTWQLRFHGLNNAPERVTAEGRPVEFTWDGSILTVALPAAPKSVHLRAEFGPADEASGPAAH